MKNKAFSSSTTKSSGSRVGHAAARRADPAAAGGTFSYNTAAGVHSVDLLALAARIRQLATLDPTCPR